VAALRQEGSGGRIRGMRRGNGKGRGKGGCWGIAPWLLGIDAVQKFSKKISSKSVHNCLRYFVRIDTQTDRHAHTQSVTMTSPPQLR